MILLIIIIMLNNPLDNYNYQEDIYNYQDDNNYIIKRTIIIIKRIIKDNNKYQEDY